MEEEGLARIPDLNIAQWIFTCKIDQVKDLFKSLLLDLFLTSFLPRTTRRRGRS